jgi:serine/threonine protein phosphatase PrpC
MDNGYPGLAMSRSIGDLVAKRVGVIWDPEITATKISYLHAFIVVGTDGVWDYMGNEKVAKLIGSNMSDPLESLCTRVISEASRCWKMNNSMIDDITVLLVKLDI